MKVCMSDIFINKRILFVYFCELEIRIHLENEGPTNCNLTLDLKDAEVMLGMTVS